MSYDFIQKLYQNGYTEGVKMEGCKQPFTTLASNAFLLFYKNSLKTNKNGLKFHLRIADKDIHEALKIVAQTTQKYDIGFFKVAHKPFSDHSDQHGKQFTVYVDESKMNTSVLNAFVNDLEQRLAQAKIQPNIIGNNIKVGDRLIPNSHYISYRYDKSEKALTTPQQLFDFLHQHKIPYQLDNEQYPRFVFIDHQIAKELLQKEYLIKNNLHQHGAPIVIITSNHAEIQLKYLTNSRPSNMPYKPPFLKDILENVSITTNQKEADIHKSFIVYPNSGYCEIFTNPKHSKQEAQKITEFLNNHNIEHIRINQENTIVLRTPYSANTENLLKENHLISSTYYSEVDKVREAILQILDKSKITQYQSSGRIELDIPTKWSELRNEMIDILQQQGIKSTKIKDQNTQQYFLSFSPTKEAIKFIETLKNKKVYFVPKDFLQKDTSQHY